MLLKEQIVGNGFQVALQVSVLIEIADDVFGYGFLPFVKRKEADLLQEGFVERFFIGIDRFSLSRFVV